MLLNYLKIAWRNLHRHMSLSLINILGLAIGIAACLLIYLYVHFEVGYDAYHPKADRIARVTSILHSPESDLALGTSPPPLGPTLLRDYPEVEATVRIQPADIVIRQGKEVFNADEFCYSEPSIFSIFFFEFLQGSPATALAAPNSIVLSRRAAKKYFGKGPALGQTLICNNKNLQVTAVFEDRPANSDLPIEALMSKDYSSATSWVDDDFETYTFVLFHQKPDLRNFDRRIAGLSPKYIQPELDRQGAKDYHFRFESEALTDVHFSKGKLVDTPKGDRQFNRIFSALAAFILVIALLNYINLSTARAAERMKEVGIRKVIGARPGQLIRQFLGESFLLVGIAWLIAIGLVELSLPFFNRIIQIKLSFGGWQVVLLPVILIPVTTLLAGAYPAFILSRFRPIKTLKGHGGIRGAGATWWDRLFSSQGGGAFLRKTLTVIQFIIALAMLAGTVVSYRQMQFVARRNLGVDRSQVLCVGIPTDSISRAGAPAFFETLRHESGIQGVTVGSGLPAEGVAMSSTTAFSNGRRRALMCNYFFIDPQFLPLLHISLVAGRNFSDSFSTDKKEGFIVNEAFVRNMGWKSPLNESMEGGYDRKGKVIGVVKDFFFKSLHNVIEPMIMIYRPDPPLAVLVKAGPGVLPRVKQLWKNHFPSHPIEYFFLDENFNGQYKKDRMTLFLFNAFTGLAIFISCLGLYGLVSLLTLQRTKEIGVRKVLGASLSGLVLLLSREQLWLIGSAALIALPLAALGAQRWLATYAYHASIDALMFVLPIVVLLLLALAVTGYRICRAALANPVESLRAE